MTDVYIGIGGNLGDRKKNIANAVSSLSGFLKEVSCSEFYKSEPMDYQDQDFFLNVVVKGKTDLNPAKLLTRTQEIEHWGGRVRNKKIPKGPRTIDLDILLYGDHLISTDSLVIPHPSMHLRRFVLIPLLELNSSIIDPQTNSPMFSHLERIEKQGVYCYSLNSYNNFFL